METRERATSDARSRASSDLEYARGRVPTASEQMEEMGIDPMGEIREFGYEFSGRRLCKLDSNEGYEHEPMKYDRLAEAVVNYVGVLLEDEAGLRPLWLPLGSEAGEGCPIYVSDGFELAAKLCVLITGAGRVGAGVWAASLCINKSLDEGTALPYVHEALKIGYGVVVLNPNCNSSDGVPVKGSESSEKHVQYVMEQVVGAQCAATRLDVVAHSVGGRSLVTYLCRASAKRLRIEHVAFTDSYHMKSQVSFLGREARDFFSDATKVVNFVPHASPLGTPVDTWFSQDYTMTQEEKGCSCVSAGVEDHAATNFAVMGRAFEFFRQGSSDLPTTPTRKPTAPAEEDCDSPSKPRSSKKSWTAEAYSGRVRSTSGGTNESNDNNDPKGGATAPPTDSHSRLVSVMMSFRDYLHGSILSRRSSVESTTDSARRSSAGSAPTDSATVAADEGNHEMPERSRSAMTPAPAQRSCHL